MKIQESFSSAIRYLFENDDYTVCEICENPLPHCHCMCEYCGKRDECECALFDAATGG